jgi:hypothetical protein
MTQDSDRARNAIRSFRSGQFYSSVAVTRNDGFARMGPLDRRKAAVPIVTLNASTGRGSGPTGKARSPPLAEGRSDGSVTAMTYSRARPERGGVTSRALPTP